MARKASTSESPTPEKVPRNAKAPTIALDMPATKPMRQMSGAITPPKADRAQPMAALAEPHTEAGLRGSAAAGAAPWAVSSSGVSGAKEQRRSQASTKR